MDKPDAISSEVKSAPRPRSSRHEVDTRKVPHLLPPRHLGHPSTLNAGDLPMLATRQSYPGPGFGSGHPSNNSTFPNPALPAPRDLMGMSPLLSATRQTAGFDFGCTAIDGTCPPQFSPAASAWNPPPNAPPSCYNTYGPRVLPPFQMERLPADPREMMNFSYQNSFMVKFWLNVSFS